MAYCNIAVSAGGRRDDNGHVKLSDDNGHVKLSDDNGHVKLSDDNGHVKLSDDNGHVKLSDNNGHVKLSDDNGHVKLSDDNGHVKLSDDNGHVKLSDDNGHVKLSDDNGHVKLMQSSNQKRNIKGRKRKYDEVSASDEMPKNISFQIRNGIRYLSPYWSIFRTWAKGRWVGRRLVDVFADEFVSLSPHYPAAACKLGRIWVNCRQMTDVNYVLQHNDSIEHIGHRHEHPILDCRIKIIDNSNDILVVDKPAGMPVHPCGNYSVHTVLGMLREQRGLRGLRVVHRLDRTTSGVLLFAKNTETDIKLKKMLRVAEMWHKEYICKVEGVFPEGEIICDRAIGPLVVSMGIQCVRDDGKHALTRFRRLWTDGVTSIVQCMLQTGRTHQIRVHLQYLGYPIVDDYIYNTTAWGKTKGRGANYGKSLEELRKDVLDEHKASNWHESMDPEYESRLQRIAEGEIQLEPEGLDIEARHDYDPICMSCNVKKKDVLPGHLMLHLHCLKYETDEWSYASEMPDWALLPNDLRHENTLDSPSKDGLLGESQATVS